MSTLHMSLTRRLNPLMEVVTNRLASGATTASAFIWDVLRWRSIFTFPYLMAVNFAFCTISFYASEEVRLRALYTFASLVVGLDLLSKSTHDNSILFEIIAWPTRDFLKTASVALSALSVYELKHEEKEEAFISSSTAVFCLLVHPPYRYHRVSEKVYARAIGFLTACRQGLNVLLIKPSMHLWRWGRWFVLFEWLPALVDRASALWMALSSKLHTRVVVPIATFLRYWLCFYWLADLRHWCYLQFWEPVSQRIHRLLSTLIYVVGCYWLRPALRRLQSASWCATKALGGYLCLILHRLALAFGFYVFEPALIAVLNQLKGLYWLIHQAVVRPMLDALYVRYKLVEDLVFIYVLGPFFQMIVKNVPERNPFLGEQDAELDDFVPSDALNRDSGRGTAAGYESDESAGSCASSPSSTSEHKFLTRNDLRRIDLIHSDSSEDEFLPLPFSAKGDRKRVAHNTNTYRTLGD